MWYYIKDDKQKAGPISDPAMVNLLKHGEIKPSTKVWSQQTKGWTDFKNTAFYKKAVGKTKNYRFETLKMRTYMLRSLMVVMAVMLGYKMYMIFQTMIYHPYDVPTIFDIKDVELSLLYNENLIVLKMLNFVILAVLAAMWGAFAIWMSSIVKASKSITSSILLSSKMAVFASIVPVANIILIPSILKRIVYTLEISMNKRRDIATTITMRTWIFVWLAMWISFAFNKWGISIPDNTEIISQIYWFRIYNSGLQILAIIFSMIVFSRIFRMIRKKIDR